MRTMFPAKTIEFENEIIGDLYLWGVPDLLEAALRILIENAVKYNNNAPTVKINAARDNECIIIEVVDDGIGIYTRQLKHLFKPYYTSDTKHGTGIGLYYAKRIITAHGGKIFATSTPGKGSTFTINLPTK
ncbi:HAMP domain-containing histidine kinase [Bacteroides pyogenes]|nr:HAMP domain-containing histidine kinase [Bacteroides pyogenes]